MSALEKLLEARGEKLTPLTRGIIEKKLIPIQEKKEQKRGTEILKKAFKVQDEPLPLTIARALLPIIPPRHFPMGAKAIPQATLEAVFPPASLFTGQLPFQTLQKGVIQDMPFPLGGKKEALQQFETLSQVGKPAILGGGTTILGAAGGLGLPSIDLSGVKNTVVVAAVAIGGLFLLSKFIGKGK